MVLKRRPIRCSLLIVLLALVGEAATAAGRWYHVEVILFRHTDVAAVGGERWVAPETLPDFHESVELITDLPEFDDEPAPRPNEVLIPGPVAFKSLPLSDRKLRGVFRVLKNSGAYEPVLHVAWRQTARGANRGRKVYVSDRPLRAAEDVPLPDNSAELLASAPEQRIEGVVALTAGRLLYLDVDFVSFGEEFPVRIREKRKIKFKEIHYFDHPLFGVIVQVTPYRLPVPDGQLEPEVGTADSG